MATDAAPASSGATGSANGADIKIEAVIELGGDLDYAQEAIKQVLGLSTGVLALSLTFASDFVASAPARQRWPLYWGWSLLLACVVVSVWCLLAATGEKYHGRDSSKRCNVRLPWLLQLATFVGGLGFLVGFGAGHLP